MNPYTIVDFDEIDHDPILEDHTPVVHYDENHAMMIASDTYFEKFYQAHVDGMTKHGLHSKSAIAYELAYRDYVIFEMARKLGMKLQPTNISGEDARTPEQIQEAIRETLTEMKSVMEELRQL